MLGHSLEDLALLRAKLGGTTLGEVGAYLGGKPTQQQLMAAMGKGLDTASFGLAPKTMGRFAGGKAMRGLARAIPGLSAGLVAMDLADVATNETSLLNKGMDATAMGVGAVLGSVAGPLGAMGGASLGKMTSDGLQYLFGDKKSPKQRDLENALAALNAGRIG